MFAPMILVDLVAISILVFAIYFPRHRRSDLAVAFLGVNIGVLAVAAVLSTSNVNAGLGLGLFGVLSIIRLRSSEISQREVAYYFSALAIGLISGMSSGVTTLNVGMIVLILVVLGLADTLIVGRFSSQSATIQLDRAIADDAELRTEIAKLMNAEIVSVHVERLDLVNDLTLVNVRVRRHAKKDTPSQQIPAAQQVAPATHPVPQGYVVQAPVGAGQQS
ncbi:MAG: DUF4956 domain-containing protein [Corynebacterium sp.]|nr:DUF4956 domain-containing protein [Corynebacterium sp.]